MEDMVGMWKLQLPINNNNTRGHQKKLYKEQSKTKIRQSQFRLRAADAWNSLPEYVVVASSIKSFERRLDKFWADQPIRFDDESQIITTCSREKFNRPAFRNYIRLHKVSIDSDNKSC